MPLDPTVGGAASNTYATLAEYKAYWQARLYNTAALAASDPVIEQALMWSCLLLNSTLRWTGNATDEVQALSWPRNGMFSPNNFSIPSNVIPAQLKDVQCEYAGILISGGDRTADNPALKVIGSETQLTSLKAGPVALSWSGGNFTSLEAFDAYVRSLGPDMAYLGKSMPDSVRLLIPPSWYIQAQLKRRIVFGAFGGRN